MLHWRTLQGIARLLRAVAHRMQLWTTARIAELIRREFG